VADFCSRKSHQVTLYQQDDSQPHPGIHRAKHHSEITSLPLFGICVLALSRRNSTQVKRIVQ
jgi:hypothetical protein